MGIHSVHIRNFKSIRDSGEFKFRRMNVFIGPNGVGKSNFISFFRFLNRMNSQELQLYVQRHGKADSFLYFGSKVSSELSARIMFDNEYKNEYEFALVPTEDERLIFSLERSNHYGTGKKNVYQFGGNGEPESRLKQDGTWRNNHLRDHFSQLRLFHFHDTSFNSAAKKASTIGDDDSLHEDAGNLAAYLYMLQESHSGNFKMIESVVRSIAPFFNGFHLQPDKIDQTKISLRWREKGAEQLFTAHNMSDGTLRMLCLATLLLQPDPPDTIIIDEPELGLHPFAIGKLAAMLKSASQSSQIIISTQSVTLLEHFDADDVVVTERKDNQTVFNRLDGEKLKVWLDDYSLGDIWEMNLIGGKP